MYPKEHLSLFEAIAKRGCVVSEQLYDRPAKRYDFPKRNRIVSGLSAATLVVESSLKSGSLITAKHALSQGREVAAVPISPLVADLQGTNELIKDGAIVVTQAQDLITLYDNQPLLVDDTTKVLEGLGGGVVSLEDLCAVTDLPPASVWSALATLELDELVAQRNGQWYRLTTG